MADSRKLLAEIEVLLAEELDDKALSVTLASLNKTENIVAGSDE